MAKHKLIIEDEFDFQLIGICSNDADYKLCWAINQTFKINLARTKDYFIHNKKENTETHFSCFEYLDENNHVDYYLIKNKSIDYKLLLPEQDKIDYIFIIKNYAPFETDLFLHEMKQIDSVLTAFIFEVEDLKSKNNLIFD